MRGFLSALLLVPLCLMAQPAWAATAVERSELSILPVLSSLFVVIVVILLLALGIKKFNMGFPGSRAIKVVSAMSLGTKERIVIVEIGGRQHVLGVTSSQINHLFSLDEPIESTNLQDMAGQQPMTFQKILENLGKKND